MRLSEVGEFGLIERIASRSFPRVGVRLGIGDDTAVTEPTPGLLSLVTTDMLVEGVHFDLSFADALSLGRKSLAVNLSDMAAMGGIPRHFLLSLALPGSITVEFLDAFADGMLEMARRYGVSLIGGDTSRSLTGLVISITLLGEQAADLVITRSGARPGDLVCVTGTVGDSALGLQMLKRGVRDGRAVARHLDPEPRVQEGMKLAAARIPSAMIDISDGLLADLGHILRLSGVGAVIYPEKIPLSEEYIAAGEYCSTDPLSFSLGGGEDYELLFTVPPEKLEQAGGALAGSVAGFTVIGEITAGSGVSLISGSGAGYTPGKGGYDHFSEV